MKIGILFHKNPIVSLAGIDLIRLRSISEGFISHCISTEIIAPVEKEGLFGSVPVKPLACLEKSGYDLIKTSYHFSIKLLGNFRGPVVSRIVRVVDEKLPERDENKREILLECQELIRRRASAVAFNNEENKSRWHDFYGDIPSVLTPTGCPALIPPPGKNPYPHGEKVILFLGSLCAGRMVRILNELALRLENIGKIHFIGKNKANLYGNDMELNRNIICHGEIEEEKIWDYIRYAFAGIVIATGPYVFDNDMSKIMNYLRGGLPVLSEQYVLNNELIIKTGYGSIFSYDNIDDLVCKLIELKPHTDKKEKIMEYMAKEHNWGKIVEIYINLFEKLLDDGL
jgi:glycosyltransferase involved in cell wall biosynthesis